MNSTTFRNRLRDGWSLLVLLLIAAVWLYRTPFSASNLEIPPDTVEYAVGALQFLETGRYEMIVQGEALPPRYPPWFSLLVLLPAYVLFGSEPGNAILPVTLLAVAGVGFAWAIGRRISGTPGGVLAGLAVLFVPSYSMWATQVMTDVPATALLLATCLLYLRLRSGPGSIALFLGAGTLIAVATLLRPVLAAMLLPFLLAIVLRPKALLARAAALLFPMALAAAATFLYNARVFGSPQRNGYKFWVAVPVDYPELMFSLSNIPMNLAVIIGTAFPLLLALCILGWLVLHFWKREQLTAGGNPLVDLAVFLVLATGPILAFHLLYFFPGDRFHLPMLAGTATAAGAILGLIVGAERAGLFKLVLPLVLVLAIAGRAVAPDPVPHRRLAAERVRQHTPRDAIVISAIDPVYLGRIAAAGTARQIVPISRNVEYASKLLVPKRIDDPQPPPRDWRDGRSPGLINAGAREAVPYVASEQLEQLVAEARRGRAVFLESMFAAGDEQVIEQLQERFRLVERAAYLYQLEPR